MIPVTLMRPDFPKSQRAAQIVWFDPGSTTGIFACQVRCSWLLGQGEPSWDGLRKNLGAIWHGQVGAHPRVWDGERNRAAIPKGGRTIARPAGGSRSNAKHGDGGLSAILDGTGRYGGGELLEATRGEIEVVLACQLMLEMWPDAAWGHEDFILRGQPGMKREALSPVRVSAMVELVELLYGERGRTPFLQSAATAKTTATDARLKLAGLYRPGMPHAVDAARHALVFLRDARQSATLRHMAWPRLFPLTAATTHRKATG